MKRFREVSAVIGTLLMSVGLVACGTTAENVTRTDMMAQQTTAVKIQLAEQDPDTDGTVADATDASGIADGVTNGEIAETLETTAEGETLESGANAENANAETTADGAAANASDSAGASNSPAAPASTAAPAEKTTEKKSELPTVDMNALRNISNKNNSSNSANNNNTANNTPSNDNNNTPAQQPEQQQPEQPQEQQPAPEPAPVPDPVPDIPPEPEAPEEPLPTAPPIVAVTGDELTFVYSGISLTLKDNPEGFAATVPPTGEPMQAPSCVGNGTDVNYIYNDFTIYAWKASEESAPITTGIKITGSGASTSKGIAVGSSADDVIAAYGSLYTQMGSDYVYNYNDCSLRFTISNGTVASITYDYPM